MHFRPPIRFVAMVLALWIGFRWLVWTPPPPTSTEAHSPVQLASAPPVASPPISERNPALLPVQSASPDHRNTAVSSAFPTMDAGTPNKNRAIQTMITARREAAPITGQRRTAPLPLLPIPSPPGVTTRARHLSVALWAQWRTDIGIEPLANAGQLGGSQAGVRIAYPIIEAGPAQISLAARLSSPMERLDGAEAALGIAVQPMESVPLSIMVDRRIALTRGGRDAWSIGIAGGVYRKPVGFGLELDGYAQTGIVGANSRDLFVDGSAAISRPVEIGNRVNLSLGAGVWGGAQPGVARLDIGPEMGLRFSISDIGMRLAVGWRQRIAGSAEPGSGPALTLGADF